MLAGNPLFFEELTKTHKNSYEELKEEIRVNFQEKRREIIDREILNTLGLDHQFILKILEAPQINVHMHTVIGKILGFNLETGILLIGFDEKQEAQITEINQEGTADFRAVNFHAIGSGFTQAINTLLFQKQSKTDKLSATIYNVYKAKRNAEVLQGVGKETDLLVLSPSQGCIDLKNHLSLLDEIYGDELSAGKTSPKLANLNLEGSRCS